MNTSWSSVVVGAVLLSGCAISPKPLTVSTLEEYADDKYQRVDANQTPLEGAVSLYEAMARALKYNLDKQVELMNVSLRNQQLNVSSYSMLPTFVANSGFANRDKYAGGSSVRILGPKTVGAESLTSSASSERDVQTADLKFSWHILDFGLSWIRAKQAADRVLIAEEQRRRVVSRIVEDVRTAYWRTVTATRLLGGLSRLEGRVMRALKNSRVLSGDGDSTPLTALTYERELIEIQREIRKIRGDLSAAKAQLAALMNVKPGTDYAVVIPRSLRQPRIVGKSAREMVAAALVNRSELREAAYNERVNEHEAEAAIVEMLPGVSFNAAPNWNSNEYLFNNNWVSWGAQASWNLMKVFTYPQRKNLVDAENALLDQRALAVTMAVMTQVHVSRTRLIHSRRSFRSAQRFANVQYRILSQIRQSLAAGKVGEQAAIREEMNFFVARIKLDLAYVELQSAFASVYTSMGLSPNDDLTNEMPVSELKAYLQSGWRDLGDRLG